MNRYRTILILAAALLAGVAAVMISKHVAPATETSRAGRLHDGNGAGKTERAGETQPPPALMPDATSTAASSDYWDRAGNVLQGARAGDRDAQFELYTLLTECQQNLKVFFWKKGGWLTLQEAVEFAGANGQSMGRAQQLFERCHKFMERDDEYFGDRMNWLSTAAKAGKPAAQALWAAEILLRRKIADIQKAAGVWEPGQVSSGDVESDPYELLQAAALSGDPEALFDVGTSQGYLNASSQSNINQYAWWLMACRRGLDCSENAEWVQTLCWSDGNCSTKSESGGYVRVLAADQWDEVKAQADAIEAAIRAKNWGAIGLEHPG